MGQVVGNLADVAVVTSDNPRSEDPDEIAAAILGGMKSSRAKQVIEIDRKSAIEAAIGMARPGDVVLVAGKGHETRQVIGDEVVVFDDRMVAREVLA
jgi:UDP-N-acetylmuramoyl-L-alanyl-D-glutamate--2,6-diaminopimelate ligase